MQPSPLLSSSFWLAPNPATRIFNASANPSYPTSVDQPRSKGHNVRWGYGLGAFAPNHTDEEWEGVIVSKSPELAPRPAPPNLQTTQPVAPTVSTTPPLATRTNNKKRKSITRPIPAQYDGAIDLTSDTELEEERQNLLPLRDRLRRKGNLRYQHPRLHSARLLHQCKDTPSLCKTWRTMS